MNLTINTDGGSRGNPGPAAWAFVAREKEEGSVIHTDAGYMGASTNNQAEYTAVLKAMEWISQKITNDKFQITNGADEKIHFVLDSELVARQLSGVYKIKDQKLMLLAQRIKVLESTLSAVISYTSVPRAQNKEADALVNAVLDEN
jgi:ribonuclease HI